MTEALLDVDGRAAAAVGGTPTAFRHRRSERVLFGREFAILFAAGAAATVLVVPYQLALAQVTIPLADLIRAIAIGWIQIVFEVGVGLALARRIGFGAPILEAALHGERIIGRLRAILPLAVALGVAVSGIVVLDAVFFAPRVFASIGGAAPQPPAWTGLLASFYGGIAEELMTRLFLVTLFAWLLHFVLHDATGRPTPLAIWLAIVLAAVLFGLGHLPATSLVVAITPIVVVRAVVLNGIAAIVFGWLYWRRGLDAAILAHFTSDLVVHVLRPMLG